MKDETIRAEGVTRRFGELTAVDNLSFSVERGEIFGLLGPNGAGKTTVIHLLTGLLRRDGGNIAVIGHDPARRLREVHRNIGYVPQETNVYLDLNALDNLWHHAALYCSDLKGAGRRIEEVLELVNLWERRREPVRTFSGGMKRRLVLARALLHDPRIVLFDEPTLGVDVQARHVIWDHIREQKGKGKTFLVTTNNMSEAENLCDRLVIIDHGRTIALNTPEGFKEELGRDIITLRATPVIEDPETFFNGLDIQSCTRFNSDKLRLEVRNAESIAGDLIARVGKKHRIESVQIARPTLDDVFLHYTGKALRD